MDEAGAARLKQPRVARGKLNAAIAALPPCVIGVEACSGAHYWARQFQAHGHTVKLMAPKLVTPYRMSGKQGKNDACSLHGPRIGQAERAAQRPTGHAGSSVLLIHLKRGVGRGG